MLGPFCVWLERVTRKISKDREDGCQRQRGVNNGRRWLRPAERFVLQETAVAKDAVRGGEGKQKRSECVEVYCFGEMSAQQSGECACDPAAGTLQVKIFEDGASGIEAVLPGGKRSRTAAPSVRTARGATPSVMGGMRLRPAGIIVRGSGSGGPV